MASPNNPKSSAQLIREHSKARVLHPSAKRFITRHNPLNGLPTFSREMTRNNVLEAQVRAFQ